ncbi:MAG: sigma-70 family RNA polymerase sigma factor [Clostridia bacterium]|nr:sigma-70 family RNA polymerase sigma factor [Clostridia bacterium]
MGKNNQVSALVVQAQAGNTDSFGQLVEIYQNKIYGLCFKLTGNHSDAEDLAQEAFIKAYQKLHTFRQEADFGTWMHRITINLYLNKKKKDSRMELSYIDAPLKTEEGQLEREIADPESDPLREITRKETSSLVHTALNHLKPEHKLVLVLREIEGYSYEEIAQLTESSLGTVKSRMNRARTALKQYLSKQKL